MATAEYMQFMADAIAEARRGARSLVWCVERPTGKMAAREAQPALSREQAWRLKITNRVSTEPNPTIGRPISLSRLICTTTGS